LGAFFGVTTGPLHPVPEPFRPIRLQKNQGGGQPKQRKPADIVKNQEMIRGMENNHAKHGE